MADELFKVERHGSCDVPQSSREQFSTTDAQSPHEAIASVENDITSAP
jgi:hypothetical protein